MRLMRLIVHSSSLSKAKSRKWNAFKYVRSIHKQILKSFQDEDKIYKYEYKFRKQYFI